MPKQPAQAHAELDRTAGVDAEGRLAVQNIAAGPVEDELRRVLASSVFINSDRLSRFLRYSVEQCLLGRIDQLKEYSLGVSVFDKRDTFDPRFDPIVRVEAGRLRLRLKQYYETQGRENPIIIDLPKGSYVPRFVAQTPPAPATPVPSHSPVQEKPNPGPNSIAVLPFVDHSPNRDQEYFCDGLTEDLISALTKLAGLRVAAWHSAVRMRGKIGNIRSIGEQLKVGAVLRGSVRKSGERVRITAQLLDTSDDSYIWSETYDRELKDIFQIQDEISQAIVGKLRIQLADGQSKHLVRRYTENFDAYNLYLKGRYYWNQRSEASLQRGIGYFERAIAQDPRYAPAHSGLADSYSLLGNYGALPARDVRAKAMAAALKAVEIDPTLAEAHTALGHVKATYDWDWIGASDEYERAMELNPAYATVHHWYAITYLTPLGLLEAALAEARKAEDLDPVSASIKRDIAIILYNSRRYDRAVEQCRKALELDPGFAGTYWALGLAFERMSRWEEAVEAIEKGLAVAPDSPRLLGALGHACGRWGQRERTAKILCRLEELAVVRHVSPFDFAVANLGMGDEEAFFRWMEQAHQSRSYELVTLRVDPRFDNVRSDSRFTRIIASLDLDRANP